MAAASSRALWQWCHGVGVVQTPEINLGFTYITSQVDGIPAAFPVRVSG
jgi:hypothetical protein